MYNNMIILSWVCGILHAMGLGRYTFCIVAVYYEAKADLSYYKVFSKQSYVIIHKPIWNI